MDITVINKHILVVPVSGDVVLDEYYDKARIETLHSVHAFDTVEQKTTFIASMSTAQFPALPAIGEWCEINSVYAYGVNKAKCLQSHNRMQYALEDTPALWQVIVTVVGYPVWVQPEGAHDAYKKGDRVHFPKITDPVYESLIDANVWSPIVYPAGWKKM